MGAGVSAGAGGGGGGGGEGEEIYGRVLIFGDYPTPLVKKETQRM